MTVRFSLTSSIVAIVLIFASPLAAQTNECGEYSYIAGNVTVNCDRETKFRFVYYRIAGLDPAYVARGELPPTMRELFDGRVYVLRNKTSDYLRGLYRKYAAYEPASYVNRMSDAESFFDEKPDLDRYKELVRKGASENDTSTSILDLFGQGTGGGDVSIREPMIMRRFIEKGYWPPDLRLARRGDKALLWRQLSREDLERQFYDAIENPNGYIIKVRSDRIPLNYRDFLRDIVGNEVPENFSIVRYDARGFCGGGNDFRSSFSLRPVEVLLLSVENVGNRSLDIGPAMLKQIDHKLSVEADSEAVVEAAEATAEPVFPIGVLKPGEAILVPMRLQMVRGQYSDDIDSAFQYEAFEIVEEDDGSMTLKPALHELQENLAFLDAELHPDLAPRSITLDKGALIEANIPEETERFVFGPETRMTGITVNGRVADVRVQDSRRYASLGGVDVGSCPYFLFSSDRSSTGWYTLGTTLTDAVGRQKAATFAHFIPPETRAIRISEIEDEVTHVDRISLKRDGVDLPLDMDRLDAALQSADGRSMTLRKGDILEIGIADLVEDPAVLEAPGGPLEVHIHGFYTEDRSVAAAVRSPATTIPAQ